MLNLITMIPFIYSAAKKSNSIGIGGTCKNDFDVYKSIKADLKGMCKLKENKSGFEILTMTPETFICHRKKSSDKYGRFHHKIEYKCVDN